MKGMIILTVVTYGLLGVGAAVYIVFMNRLRTLAKAEKARRKELEQSRKGQAT